MAFYDTFLRLERLATLIASQQTGTPAELAYRLEVAPRTLDTLLEHLKNLSNGQTDIAYCRQRKTYYFTEKVKVDFGVLKKN